MLPILQISKNMLAFSVTMQNYNQMYRKETCQQIKLRVSQIQINYDLNISAKMKMPIGDSFATTNYAKL